MENMEADILNKVSFGSDGNTVKFSITFKTFLEWKYVKLQKQITCIELLNKSLPNHVRVCVESNTNFEERLSRLYYLANRRLSKSEGGRQRAATLSKTFNIYLENKKLVNVVKTHEDLRVLQEKHENAKVETAAKVANLQKEKPAAEVKVQKLEEENNSLQNYVTFLRKDNINPMSLVNMQRNETIGTRQQQRQIVNIGKNIDKALWFLKSFGLEVEYVKCHKEEGRDVYFGKKEDQNRIDDILNIIHIMDRYGIGDAAYHEISMLVDRVPRSYLVKQERQNMNNMFHIERTPGFEQGVQLDLFHELPTMVKETYEDLDTITFKVQIKISGDGAKMARNSHFTIISCTMLETGIVYPIAIIKAAESFEMLESCLADVFKAVNTLIERKTVTIDGKDIEFEVFFGGDYKFLLMVMGLSGATSNYACLWCEVEKSNRYDMSKGQDFYNQPLRRRTLESLKACAATNSKSCKHPPLLNIELNRVIVDELHLFLRISDILMENLVNLMLDQDKKQSFKKKKEVSSNARNLEKECKKCGVSFQIWEKRNADGSGSGTFTYTSLMGDDKKKLVKSLPESFSRLILDNDIATKISTLWEEFGEVYATLTKEKPSSVEIAGFHQQAATFINNFLSLGGKVQGHERKRVTPYMHILVYHAPSFLVEHKSVKVFTGQGVEKLNDNIRSIHLRKSSHFDSCLEAMRASKRLQALSAQSRTKRGYKYHTPADERPQKKARQTIGIEVRNDTKENMAKYEELMEYTESELKKMLAKQGVKTKIRRKDALVKMLLKQ